MINFFKVLVFIILCLDIIPFFSSCKREERPTVTTAEVTNITGTTATSGGTITDEGSGSIVEKGICWSKETSSTIDDSRTIETGGEVTFISNITSLDADTKYYVRAYAINNAGIGYGSTVSFATVGQAPSATTNHATSQTVNSAKLNGTVNANYLSTKVTFEYGTSTNYGQTITASQSPVSGNSNTKVNADVTELLTSTTYHFRVKTENILGTAFGNDMSFTTLPADIDGNIYYLITIGTQTWMAENLRVTKYNDGTSIPFVNSISVWTDLITPGYCWYYDNVAYKNTHGALYNWFVVDASSNGSKNVCPTGWHIPSDAEWTVLTNYLGGQNVAGGKLKETGALYWSLPNTGATNETGFTALGSGNRDIQGWYREMGLTTYWWSATEYDALNAWFISLAYNSSIAVRNNSWKRLGLPIRCLKD